MIQKPLIFNPAAPGALQMLAAGDRLSPYAIIGRQKAILALGSTGSVPWTFANPYATKPNVQADIEDPNAASGVTYARSLAFTQANGLYIGVTLYASRLGVVAGVLSTLSFTGVGGLYVHFCADDSALT